MAILKDERRHFENVSLDEKHHFSTKSSLQVEDEMDHPSIAQVVPPAIRQVVPIDKTWWGFIKTGWNLIRNGLYFVAWPFIATTLGFCVWFTFSRVLHPVNSDIIIAREMYVPLRHV